MQILYKSARSWAAAACGVALACAVTGCTSLPSPEAMRAATADVRLPQSPSAGKALVYVLRSGPELYGAGFAPVFVYVDDAGLNDHAGYTRSDQYLALELPPGAHSIGNKLGNQPVPLQLKAGETRFIEQTVHPAGLVSLKEIDETTAKYLLKSRGMTPGSPPDKGK